MLYHRVPMMRGDDVSVLQRRLNALGFDAGKVDGTFGPDTLRALLDFQANRRMAEDGIAGAEVVSELELMARATSKDGRQAVRERQWLASLPTHLAGQRVYVDAFCRSEGEAAGCWEAAVEFATAIQRLGGHPVFSRSADTFPAEQVRAVRANRMGADFVVAFATPRDGEPAVFYFASTHSHSAAGEKIAAAVAQSVGLPGHRSVGPDAPGHQATGHHRGQGANGRLRRQVGRRGYSNVVRRPIGYRDRDQAASYGLTGAEIPSPSSVPAFGRAAATPPDMAIPARVYRLGTRPLPVIRSAFGPCRMPPLPKGGAGRLRPRGCGRCAPGRPSERYRMTSLPPLAACSMSTGVPRCSDSRVSSSMMAAGRTFLGFGA